MPSFQDIPRQYNPGGGVTFEIDGLETYLAHAAQIGLDIDPDFQRPHVWTEAQQIAFMENLLQDGMAGRTLYFNRGPWSFTHKNGKTTIGTPKIDADCVWQGYSQYVLVDGKQRLQAARRWVRDEIPTFGYYKSQFEGDMPHRMHFLAVYGELKTRAEVLSWYIALNSSGTPHTPEEIEHVKWLRVAAEHAKGYQA